MSAEPTASFKPWSVMVNGSVKVISVLSTHVPDGILGGGGANRFKILNLVATNADYFQARAFDSVTNDYTGAITDIVKHYKHRPSIGSEDIDGITVTYDYLDNNTRISNDGNNIQKEKLFPLYQTGDIVFASSLTLPETINASPTPKKMRWVDMTPRVWARKRDQT